jgi:hypothetical protein
MDVFCAHGLDVNKRLAIRSQIATGKRATAAAKITLQSWCCIANFVFLEREDAT